MATIKSYTDIEQSKVLAKILPLESADMHYATWTILDGGFVVSPNQGRTIEDLQEDYGNQIIPCWSLASLLNLLPSEFTYYETTYEIQIRKYALTKGVDLHQIAYGSIKFDVDGQFSFKDMVNTGEKENLVDACYEMVTILKERNLI